MVYDFVPDNNQEKQYKKNKSTFSGNFLYIMIRNYLLIFLVSTLIFISLIDSDSLYQIVPLVLFSIMLLPIIYFIYNLGKFPDQKATYFVRLILFLVSSLVTVIGLISLFNTEIIYNNWGNILVAWIFTFASIVVFGNIFKINASGNIIINSKTPDTAQYQNRERKIIDKDSEPYLKDILVSKLFSKNDLKYIGLYFYFYLGGSIFLLWFMSISSRAEYLIEGPLSDTFLILFGISIFISVLSAFFRTLYEKNTRRLLIRDLIISRMIIYLFISLIIGIIYSFIYSMLYGYYDSNSYYDLSFVGHSIQLISVWMIPLLLYSLFYYKKRSDKHCKETFEILMESSLARNLSRYYLLTRLSEIKTILNSTDPLDFDMKFKKTIENNIHRLVESCNSNGISIKSKKGLKRYVLHVATPLRESLREAIGQNFTEIYLSDEIPSEERVINYDEVWRKINKAFLQWESGSSKE